MSTNADVRGTIATAAKCLAAAGKRAHKRPGTRMRRLVNHQVGVTRKALLTNGTHVGPRARVQELVPPQVALLPDMLGGRSLVCSPRLWGART